ncbi:M1 family metallopeptidase [Wenyingzhuangia sp. IMCC45574]
MKKIGFLLAFVSLGMYAQNWQQKADYKMDIDMDVKTFQYTGTQKLTYHNNSPELIKKVYYHLYFNAFQPGSAMDLSVQNTPDADKRMMVNKGTKEKPDMVSRISLLQPNEIGYLKIKSLKQNGEALKYHVEGTILEVELNEAIPSLRSAVFDMEFEGQVPNQVRRSGRESKEGVALSMTQWYPKLAAYDDEGWHANPYLGAEFYADWGNYEVNISIDKKYTIGGSGYLQNPNEVGHGYETTKEDLKVKAKKGKLTWKFIAPNVHDFSWAADSAYQHITHQVPNGPVVHLLFKEDLKGDRKESWKKLPKVMDQLFDFYGNEVGKYPYKQYTVIQGGDGGMEYAMCTLITGDREYESLVGVVAHELAHTWFQFLLASNEHKHAWLDEGFTTYISTLIERKILGKKGKPFERTQMVYKILVNRKTEEPLTTHGDAYDFDYGYGISSYYKGSLFLDQLEYIIGKEALRGTLKRYFKEYSFKHPKPEDFIRVAEKVAEMELDWYLNFWVETTKTIDYKVGAVDGKKITLLQEGKMPMPIDVTVTYIDGSQEKFYIPLDIMRGEKPTNKVTVLKDWAWGKPMYSFEVEKEFKKIEIDPENQMVDVERENNILSKE